MNSLQDTITKIQNRVKSYKNQVDNIREDLDEEIDDMQEEYTQLADWIEVKEAEMMNLVSERQKQGDDPEDIAAEIDGMLEDVEDTIDNFASEYSNKFDE